MAGTASCCSGRTIIVFLAAGSFLSAVLSLGHGRTLLLTPSASQTQQKIAASRIASQTQRLLQVFPGNVRELEQRLLKLEEGIATFRTDATGLLQKGSAAAPVTTAASGPAAAAVSSSLPPAQRSFRKDLMCGGRVPEENGLPIGCDPRSETPCCSETGYCGNTEGHCSCEGCVDYRTPPPPVVTLPPPPLKDDHEGKVVVVVIPFRDREGHLIKFKEYWRWFAEKGNPSAKVGKWEIYVAEQFDAVPFNRGWNFNVGLAMASAQTSASPEVTPEMGFDFDCAVIQDIDYLPEEQVNYGECSVPIQLSSEIDRFGWKTPYVQSCGGIVSMRLRHWRKINGFGNDYFGWGGEDDELFHRLRLNQLLYGDCYPFCTKNDKWIGKTGKSILRPPKGHGRFSGKFMHSANHTKRITDSAAYDRNIKMLKEIEKGGSRWKTDGLSSLAFRIVDYQVDRTDSEKYGITYHHVRARRGSKDFLLSELQLAVPQKLCVEPGAAGGWLLEGWNVQNFKDSGVAWDLNSLREQTASRVGCSTAAKVNFLLLDRRRNLAKVLTDEDPRLLIVFYRSLEDPPVDGLIIAQPLTKAEIIDNFRKVGSFVAPAAPFSICTSALKAGLKYSIHQAPQCTGGGWKMLGEPFRAFAKPRDGMQAITFCDNERYWIQRMVPGETCQAEWNGLQWVRGGTLWVPSGNEYCIGTQANQVKAEFKFSRVLPQEDCGGAGFRHELTFKGVSEQHVLTAMTICIGLIGESTLSVTHRTSCDKAPGDSSSTSSLWKKLVQFPARTAASAGKDDRLLCVDSSATEGDIVMEKGHCGAEKLTFAVPQTQSAAAGPRDSSSRLRVCIQPAGRDQPRVQLNQPECRGGFEFETPSLLDILASVPGGPARPAPLFTVVEEDVPCFPFLCPSTLQNQS